MRSISWGWLRERGFMLGSSFHCPRRQSAGLAWRLDGPDMLVALRGVEFLRFSLSADDLVDFFRDALVLVPPGCCAPAAGRRRQREFDKCRDVRLDKKAFMRLARDWPKEGAK